MTVYAKVGGVSMNIVSGTAQLSIALSVGFDNSGQAVNTDMYAYVSGLSLATGLLVDNALRTAVRDFVNGNYSLSITTSNVILSGGFNVPLL